MFLLHRLKITNFKQLTDVALTFPESGSVLIEGPNEAGKSSLFEAVYFALFGKSLISEQFYHLADLKQHGADSMQVELEFSIEGRRFTIRRKCGANQTVEFICPTLTEPETLRGIGSVSKRLQEELRFSAGALLNTCFVEQKCLENLEQLPSPARQATINELLNLRSLTLLSDEFKISPDDKRALQNAERRVEIARWDERLPMLLAEREAALRAKDYLTWGDLWQRGNEIAAGIETAVAERKSAETSLAEIDQRLSLAQQLQETLRSVRTDLPLRVSPWAASLETAGQAEQAVAEIVALAQQLPERRTLLATWTQWAGELERLEDLERKAPVLAADFQSRKKTYDDYVQTNKDWEIGERERVLLEAEFERCRDARDAAQAEMDIRAKAKTGNARGTLLLQHLSSYVTALTESEALQGQIAARQDEVASLPLLEEREGRLTQRESDLRQERDDRAALVQVQENLKRCDAQITEAKATQGRIDAALASLQEIGHQLAAAQQAEAAAERVLREVTLASALREWADAREQVAAVDSRASLQGDLPERLRLLQSQIAQEAASTTNLTQRRLMAFAVSGVGIVAIIIGALIHLPILWGAAGMVALAGGIGAALTHRTVIAAAAKLTKKREDQKGMEGELRAMETQSRANLQHCQQVRERDMRAGETLQKLDADVPDSPEEARRHIGGLSPMPMAEAQGRREAARNTIQRCLMQQQGVQQDVARDMQSLTRQNLPGLQQNYGQFMIEEQRLETALEAYATVPSEFHALSLENGMASLTTALAATRQQIAASRNAIHLLPQSEAALRLKTAFAQQEKQNARQIAVDLGIEEASPEALRADVEQAQRNFAQLCIRMPDNLLTTRLQQAQAALESADREYTLLNARQTKQRAKLDATNPDDLEAAVQGRLKAVNANADAQESLASVRSKLLQEQLPSTTQELRTAIALSQHTLERDGLRVAGLPEARRKVKEDCDRTALRQQELQMAWQATLPNDPLPASPASALEHLRHVESETQTRLAAFNVPSLAQKRANFTGVINQANARIASSEEALRVNLEDQSDTKSSLNALPDETLADYYARFPELNSAKMRTIDDWTVTVAEKTREIHGIEAKRRQQADEMGLSDTPINLAESLTARDDQKRENDVKTRASDIVRKTRETITNKVMPLTLQNMRQLMPLLTAGRYHEVEWNAGENLLYVYDQSARSMQRKRVFSGGARDQISLALRLAFALATLPGESHARPGWLFLDEPLSSFDRQRTRDLVDLLTRGVVKTNFAQVFLVSHSESFDPSQFDYRVKMSGGAIMESTLPSD